MCYLNVFLFYQFADINQNIKHITTAMLMAHLCYAVVQVKMYKENISILRVLFKAQCSDYLLIHTYLTPELFKSMYTEGKSNPAAAPSKEWVCSRSLTVIACSKPGHGCMAVYVL